MAPVIEALIVAHGQPSDPVPAERALAEVARQVRAHLPGARIGSATVAAPGALERAVSSFEGRFAVYPLFMASGWFVNNLLRNRLEGTAARFLPPLGLDARLVAVASRCILEKARQRGWAPNETELFLAAHGSATGPRAARSANAFAAALRQRLPGPVRVGFIEEEPFVQDVITELGARALCLPFFAANGHHVRFDLQQALARAGRQDILLAPLGTQRGIPQLIARAIQTSAAEAGMAV